MPENLGYAFAPTQPTPGQPGAAGAGGARLSPQESVRILSLRLPKRAGPGAIAPQQLLEGAGGAGAPGSGLNALLRSLMQAFGAGGGAPLQGVQAPTPRFTVAEGGTGLDGGGVQPAPPTLPGYLPPGWTGTPGAPVPPGAKEDLGLPVDAGKLNVGPSPQPLPLDLTRRRPWQFQSKYANDAEPGGITPLF